MESTHVSDSPSVSGCAAMVYSFTNKNGSAVDSAVFTYSSSDTQFTVYSTDATKAGVYDLTLKAVYGSNTNYGELDFTVLVIYASGETPYFKIAANNPPYFENDDS